MTRDNNRESEEQSHGLLGAVRLMIRTLADTAREREPTSGKRGRTPDNHFRTRTGFAGQVGGPRRESDSWVTRHSWHGDTADSGSGENDSYRVDVREGHDELLVVVDMPGVDREDITAGIEDDGETFVVGIDGQAVERLDLPWSVGDVQTRFQHGILELRFSREVGE